MKSAFRKGTTSVVPPVRLEINAASATEVRCLKPNSRPWFETLTLKSNQDVEPKSDARRFTAAADSALVAVVAAVAVIAAVAARVAVALES